MVLGADKMVTTNGYSTSTTKSPLAQPPTTNWNRASDVPVNVGKRKLTCMTPAINVGAGPA